MDCAELHYQGVDVVYGINQSIACYVCELAFNCHRKVYLPYLLEIFIIFKHCGKIPFYCGNFGVWSLLSTPFLSFFQSLYLSYMASKGHIWPYSDFNRFKTLLLSILERFAYGLV